MFIYLSAGNLVCFNTQNSWPSELNPHDVTWSNTAKTKQPNTFFSRFKLLKACIFQFTWCSFLLISETYPTFQFDKSSLLLVSDFYFSIRRLFITSISEEQYIYSKYLSKRLMPGLINTKARTQESAQMLRKKITENYGASCSWNEEKL